MNPVSVIVLAAAFVSPLASGQDLSADPAVRLNTVLNRAAAYCDRLNRAAIDFVCFEDIAEKLDLSKDDPSMPGIQGGMGNPTMDERAPSRRRFDNRYVYDLQFVRKNGVARESRVLVQKNGRKVRKAEADLETEGMRVENALFGPVGLFGRDWRRYRSYETVEETSEGGVPVMVVDARLSPQAAETHPCGRAWVRVSDGAVLRIRWDQKTLGNFAFAQQRATDFGGTPQIASETEYGLERNGLRFPSRDVSEEAYLLDEHKFVRSLTTIAFRDYKFFTVETDAAAKSK